MKKKFRCLVCGYVYEGENPPAECPQCHAKSDKFVEVKSEGGLQWACEHHLGDGRVEDEEIMQGLHDHFNGECTEVGMYLAMSRQAEREGYPEIAEAFKRYAFEEAEHAAKFAELLGEVVWDTKTNLEKRAEAECGACEGKLAIATRAKKLGYDAIHDTVHEMLFWDVNNGIARRSWARNEGSIDAIKRQMEQTPDFQVTLPNFVDDDIINQAF